VAGVDRHPLGVAATGEQRHGQVALAPARDAWPEREHLAGRLQAGDLGHPRRRRVAPEPLQDVGPVDRGGPHAQEELPGAERRLGHVGPAQDVGAPRALGDERLHACRGRKIANELV
jgi:hypothetical protein